MRAHFAQSHGFSWSKIQQYKCFIFLKIRSAKYQLYFVYYCYTPQSKQSKMEKYGLPDQSGRGALFPESSPQRTRIFSEFYGFYTFTWPFILFLYFLMVFYGLPWVFYIFCQKKINCLSWLYTFCTIKVGLWPNEFSKIWNICIVGFRTMKKPCVCAMWARRCSDYHHVKTL